MVSSSSVRCLDWVMRFNNSTLGADTATGTRVGVYQEWSGKDAQRAYAKARSASGFLATWFGFAPASEEGGAPTWSKLHGDGPLFEEYEMTMSKPAFDA